MLERISHVQETNHIMSIIINELVGLCGADQGVINLVSRDSESELVTVVRQEQETPQAIPYKVCSQISGWVLAKKTQAMILNSLKWH